MSAKRIPLLLIVIASVPVSSRAETSKVSPKTRKEIIAKHLMSALPGYAETIVSDPRFDFEPRIVARYKHQIKRSAPPSLPHPRLRKHNFDYVVSAWAKQEGPKFMERNEAVFQETGKQFPRVPKEIVIGTLDAETQYGVVTRKADYPIVPTLLTIAAYQPTFQTNGWAERELNSFLRICQKIACDPFEEKGSRTGAMKKPQFEPTSYERFAMRWNGSACESWKTSAIPPDLDDDKDAICSTFNYLDANVLGESELNWRRTLHRYNKDWTYCDAILEIADFFAGRTSHHHYQPFAKKQLLRAAPK